MHETIRDALQASTQGTIREDFLDEATDYLATRGVDNATVLAEAYELATPERSAELAHFYMKDDQRFVEGALFYVRRWVLGAQGIYELEHPQVRRRMIDFDGGDAWSSEKKFRGPTREPALALVHPKNARAVADVDVPLILTEGPVKRDALLSALGTDDYGVVAYTGVRMPTIARGNARGPRPGDFLALHRRLLRGREVILAFDGDAATNRDVAAGVDQTAAVCTAAGADVEILSIPGGLGIDDYLRTPRQKPPKKSDATVTDISPTTAAADDAAAA